jgi:hypothetical protein
MTDWSPITISPPPVTITIGADVWPLSGWAHGSDRGHRTARTGAGDLVTLVVWTENGERCGSLCIGDAQYNLRALVFENGITGEAEYSPPDQWYLDFVARLTRAVSA